MSEPTIKPVSWTDVERYRQAGYEILSGGDAAKACGEHFVVLVKDRGNDKQSVVILCPTFLRGALGITEGMFSY